MGAKLKISQEKCEDTEFTVKHSKNKCIFISYSQGNHQKDKIYNHNSLAVMLGFSTRRQRSAPTVLYFYSS